MNVPEFVVQLVDNGVEVTLCKNESLGYYFDLNLRAKSHMYLYQRKGRWYVNMRYDAMYEVETFEDLVSYAENGMHGRDYADQAWLKLIQAKK